MFFPHSCMGLNPLICRTGPIFNPGRQQCARGIITGDNHQREDCILAMRKHNSNHTLITEVLTGEYVIVTWGESSSIRCEGKRGELIYVPTGTHKVKINKGCSLSGEGWFLEGSYNRLVKLSLSAQQVTDIPISNILFKVPEENALQKLRNPSWDKLGEVVKMPLHHIRLNGNEEDILQLSPNKESSFWISSIPSFIFVIIAVITCVIGYRYRKSFDRAWHNARPNCRQEPEVVPLRLDRISPVEKFSDNEDEGVEEASVSKMATAIPSPLSGAQGFRLGGYPEITLPYDNIKP